jgi:hypothetical protein
MVVQEITASHPIILRHDGHRSPDLAEADRVEQSSDATIAYETLVREDRGDGPGALVAVRHTKGPGAVGLNAEGLAVWRGMQLVVYETLAVRIFAALAVQCSAAGSV